MDAILNDVPVCMSNHMNATLLRDFSSDEGLKFALDLGFHSVIVESDYRAVISKLCSNIPDISDMGLRYSEDRFWVEDTPDRVRRLAAEDKRLLVPP
ncbi:hypothetical protein V6N13_051834 [Hibiscus sabdariffa]|uniref:RNase H type-1 domain-containing protein n=1 Tax=Hibiscus sabdariffa TaxID=183260 RepID=A0ABR2T592_9ROSI